MYMYIQYFIVPLGPKLLHQAGPIHRERDAGLVMVGKSRFRSQLFVFFFQKKKFSEAKST